MRSDPQSGSGCFHYFSVSIRFNIRLTTVNVYALNNFKHLVFFKIII